MAYYTFIYSAYNQLHIDHLYSITNIIENPFLKTKQNSNR